MIVPVRGSTERNSAAQVRHVLAASTVLRNGGGDERACDYGAEDAERTGAATPAR
jgi:hypothetical protein